MKKIIAILSGVAMLFASCENVNSMSEEDIRKSLAKSNISDAEYLYVRQATRTGDGTEEEPQNLSGGWKVDKSGNASRIVVYDQHGAEVDMDVLDIIKRSNNYVTMNLCVHPRGADDIYMTIMVDKTTDKIYQCDLDYMGGEAMYVEKYPRGVLYYAHYQIYKITFSPEAMVEEALLPDGEHASNFLLAKDGVVYYNDDHIGCYAGNGVILMPSKRLYPANADVVFISGDRELFYGNRVDNGTTEMMDIYHWQVVASNEMKSVKIATLPGDMPKYIAPMNTLNGKAVLFCANQVNGNGEIYEADSNGVVLKKSFVTDSEKNMFYGFVGTIIQPDNNGRIRRYFGQNNYVLAGTVEVFNLDATTYDLTKTTLNIPLDEYKVNSIEIDESTGKAVFRALRYLDGANVLGEVDTAGVIKIIGVQTSQYQITKYCALN